MRVYTTLLVTAFITWTTSPARAHALSMETVDRHQAIDALMASWDGQNTPGCVIGVSRDGDIDHVRGYGMSNLEYDVPITPQSVFHVASISKQFTAFSIGLLARDGKMSINDDIRKFLPEMANIGQRITIANLIHHTDGLREQGQLLNLAGWRGDDLYTQDDVLWALARQRSLNFEPGTEIVYGNAAYTLLAVIVQRVSGQSLRAFTNARIFQPLGMADSHFRDDHTEITRGRTAGYVARSGGGWSIGVPNIDHYGSTGLLTTVGDLLKWEQNLIDGRIGGKALVDWMRTSGALSDGTNIGYGAGLRLGKYRGLRIVSHDGADGGYRAEAALFPDQKLAVVALCNGATIEPTGLTRRVAEIYLGDRMGSPTLAPAVATPAAQQSALAGTYWSARTDEIVRLEWKDGALRQMGSATALVPIGDGVYRPGDLAHEWRFVMPAAGAAAGSEPELHIRDFWPTQRAFVRVSLPLPSASDLQGLSGYYRSEETDMTYAVDVTNGGLLLTWPRGYAVALDAIGGDRFIGSQGTVTFTRRPSGEVDGLTISNRRLRRFRADRRT
ncbi:serine hydrolase domain-containing protein [Sphingomonas sp. PP-CC-3G-468]|uniref:serine hydrolase domain-containing protein n=1 Tax=Sphingomonas sp. PP-CC-3G-468 TaxID=2135656 RepID=UPI001045CE0F|nr:serine hydrolase domain-containing protein [Sphingomonas sp. PP-CC-3G-468]TCM04722.1 CubicO group peptidase (beta-lactamase class C family) [Sphingomonas sp. PP-CC-3G-468]